MAGFNRSIGDYLIGRTLGSGMSAKVKLGTHKQTEHNVALKLIDKSKLTNRAKEMLEREITAMKAVYHPNTLQLIDVELDATYPKKNGATRQVALLVIEMAHGGELFDYLMHTGPFSEDVSRAYFSSLLSALDCCHSQGIFHRDLKPENLMLDGNYQLKVADFGLSAVMMTDGDDVDTLLETECGTRSYMAPEILAHRRYQGSKADIWSAGVVLFIMMTGHPPFQMANDTDWWFNAVKQNRHDRFWAAHLRTNPNLSEAFQQFINTIFVAQPEQRASLEDLRQHVWMQGDIIGPEDIKQELEDRRARVDAVKQTERLRAQAERAARNARGTRRVNIHDHATNRKLGDLIPPPLPLDLMEMGVLFSPETAEDMLDAISKACAEMSATDVRQNVSQCKMKASFPPSPESGSSPVQIGFQIYYTQADASSEKICALHLQRRTGDIFEFQKVQKAFQEKLNLILVCEPIENTPALTEEELITDEVGMV
jgi:serine/threonine protein kinase